MRLAIHRLFEPKRGFDPGEKLSLIHGLSQKIVGTGFDPF
jgi:hypothetical protein